MCYSTKKSVQAVLFDYGPPFEVYMYCQTLNVGQGLACNVRCSSERLSEFRSELSPIY